MKGEKRRKRWALWAATTEEKVVTFYDPPVPIVGKPPAEAERSADGNWATVWRDSIAIATWVRQGV